MSVQWNEAEESERVADDEAQGVIEHLAAHGVLDEAVAVMTAIDAGTDDAPTILPDEVRRRLRALVDG